MITAGYIILIIVWLAFLFALFFGGPGDDTEDPTIDVWHKQ